ncbi:protein DDB_G0287365-like [Pomacea canaliculata]|uniref:protein DDB_G0287365-like n=1 Tax=Pomacea canaliculata TaxID=400727 RepID=UPI000D73DDC0|nr:protein DDB_G0287365-like [Pomacea canaliculata]
MSRLKTFIGCLHLVCTLLTRHLSMASQCPWEQTGLLRWSDSATWPLGQKPGENAEVSVRKRLLLDESPPRLANLTVDAGGALIWDNVDDILLQASYIRVIGEFHMGSQSCPLNRRATISLYGNSISKYEDTWLGRKFLGVRSGGVMELHGKPKTSWTRLAHTVPALSSASCGFVYSHSTSPYAAENKVGLFVTSWYPDGAVFDFGSFDASTWMDLPTFLEKMPQGCVLAASVRSSLGVGSEALFTSLERLGAQQVRNIGLGDSYAFIARMGDKTTALERLASGTQSPDTEYLHLSVAESNLTFSVRSSGTNVDFRVLTSDLAFPVISLDNDVSSWEPGDEVVITSTDYDWEQVEVRRILPCSTCSKNQIRLDGALDNMHYGEVSQNVDMRAEVGLLTRNIKIQGIMEPQCYNFTDYEYLLCQAFQKDTFGGQIKALRGSTIHVEGVELYHMGQQASVGAYPLHFHMMVEARGMWFRNNSIHHSFSRCVTVHGSHNTEVSDHVCYDHLGHGYFLEDAVEQNTTMYRNLGVGTRYGMLTPGDRTVDMCKNLLKIPEIFCNDVSTFWLTHPNNNIINNVAAGSDGHGYGMIFADRPLTLSAKVPELVASAPPYSSQYFPLTRFYGNVAHSNSLDGLFFDSKIASGGENYQGDVAPPNASFQLPTTTIPEVLPTPTGHVSGLRWKG